MMSVNGQYTDTREGGVSKYMQHVVIGDHACDPM